MTTSYRGVVAAGLFLLVGSPVVMIWSWETDRVDQCITRGGTFDYDAMRCDLDHGEHPFLSFGDRHPGLVTATLAGGAVALAAGVALTRQKTG